MSTPDIRTRTQKEIVVDELVVRRRLERKRTWHSITSNGTIAAAIMLFATLLAVFLANSPIYQVVHEALQAPVGLVVGNTQITLTFEQFVNDFLMAIFFLLVGIELKYELRAGQLKDARQAALPMLAAVGGVCIPSLIYALINVGEGGITSGWAVPMATDIAFALGIMSVLGTRVKPATKVFFSTLAIADDILAIIVIALFYGQTPNLFWMGASGACIVVLTLLKWRHVYEATPYLIAGAVLWVCMFNSGIHATMAGVVLALFLPTSSQIQLDSVGGWLANVAEKLDEAYDEDTHILGQHEFSGGAMDVKRVMHHVTPALQRVEHAISIAVNFVILPLFAFCNAQVSLAGVSIVDVCANPIAQGIFLGAVVGKPVGIVCVTYLLVKVGLFKLPRGLTWNQIIGVGLLGGLGFTMSILISGLAFTNTADVLAAKCAILAGSLVASLAGIIYLICATRGQNR